MAFSPPNGGGGIERGNRLGARPVVRQSQIYRERESGNAMKGIFGQDHLAWDTQNQQGAFQGQGVYDANSGQYTGGGGIPAFGGGGGGGFGGNGGGGIGGGSAGAGPSTGYYGQQQQHEKRASFAPGIGGAVRGGSTMAPEPEYPNPGSSASCDCCGEVAYRYYHCTDCREETGLFDLCTECCAAVYLQKGPPQLLAKAKQLQHPTHAFVHHTMQHVVPASG